MEKSDDCEEEGVRVGFEETTMGEDFGLAARADVRGDAAVYDWDL